MKYFNIFVLVTAFAAVSFAGQNNQAGLTAIERDPCLMFPEITKVSKATAGVDYIASEKYHKDCDDDVTADCSYLQLYFEYNYYSVTITDYYNSAGTLVTSKSTKESDTLSEYADDSAGTFGKWEYLPNYDSMYPADEAATSQLKEIYQNGVASLLIDIHREIKQSAGVCPNSFYK